MCRSAVPKSLQTVTEWIGSGRCTSRYIGFVFLFMSFPAVSVAQVKTAVFVDVSVSSDAIPSGYDAMLRTKISDELEQLGLRVLNPEKIASFNKTAYDRILRVVADLYSEATRIEAVAFRTNDDAVLFRYPFWLEAKSQDSGAKRLFNDSVRIRMEFAGRIKYLYQFYGSSGTGATLLASCIFPPSAGTPTDWNYSAYITAMYSQNLKLDVSHLYHVIGIPSGAFNEWCQQENPALPISLAAFDANVWGQTFKFEGESKILVTFQLRNDEPVTKVVSVAKGADQTAASLATEIMTIVSGKQR